MSDDPIIIGNKRRSQIFSLPDRVYEYATEETERIIMELVNDEYFDMEFNGSLDEQTIEALKLYGKNTMMWMDRLVHNTLQQPEANQKLSYVQTKLVLASLQLGKGRFEDHSERINYILEHGENQTGFLMTSSDVTKSIRSFRTTSAFNHLYKHDIIKMDNYEGPNKNINQKVYSLPYHFMSIDTNKLYALIFENVNGVKYSMKQLIKDVPNYHWNGIPISEDLDKPPSKPLEDDDIVETSPGTLDNNSDKFIFKILEPFKGENLEFQDIEITVVETSKTTTTTLKAKNFKVKA